MLFARSFVDRILKALRRVRQAGQEAVPKSAFSMLVVTVGGGPIVFQSASVALQELHAGYNPLQQAISSLVFGPFGWLQTAAFYVFGVSLLALATALSFRIKLKLNIGVIALALIGAAFTVVGGNPASAPGVAPALSGIVHQAAAIFIVVCFPIACFLIAPSLRASGHAALRLYTIGAGIFALLFLTIGGAFLVARFSMVGLYERVLLWNGQLWVEIVCAQLVLDRLRGDARIANLGIQAGHQESGTGSTPWGGMSP